MTTAWLLNAVGLFVTTVGALLTFLYLHESPASDKFASPEARRDLLAPSAHAGWVVGLLAAWLVVQCLAGDTALALRGYGGAPSAPKMMRMP